MRCDVCGQEYGVAHNCAGVPPMVTSDEVAPPPVALTRTALFALGFPTGRK
jgi:hypothetical protein